MDDCLFAAWLVERAVNAGAGFAAKISIPGSQISVGEESATIRTELNL
jgi:hypothetical protein